MARRSNGKAAGLVGGNSWRFAAGQDSDVGGAHDQRFAVVIASCSGEAEQRLAIGTMARPSRI